MNHEQLSPREGNSGQPTKAQITAANIALFLKVTDAVRHEVKNPKRGQRRAARDALTDAYLVKANLMTQEQYNHKWDTHPVAGIDEALAEILPQLDEQKKALRDKASTLSVRDRMNITAQATRRVTRLSQSQRQELFMIAGYPPDIAKKLGISAALTFATGNAANLITGAAITLEATHPIADLTHITDLKTAAYIGLSYLAQYTSISLPSRTNRQLLEYDAINTCPNIWAMTGHLLWNKVAPTTEHSRWGVRAGTFAPALLQEFAMIPTLLIPGIGPHVVFARNMAGVVFNTTEAGGNTIWRKVIERRERRKNQPGGPERI